MSHPFEGDYGPPNLDCFSIDPEDYNAAERVFKLYTQYLGIKHSAMRYRLAGDIQKALRGEKMLDEIYKQLPDWAKW